MISFPMNSIISVGSLALLLLLASPSNATHDCPVVGGPGDYTYNTSAPNGPDDWGTIESFETCGTGMSQSPIDFPMSFVDPDQAAPTFVYRYPIMELKSSTENWALECRHPGLCGKMYYNCQTYDVVNIHFHTPSEHLINGVQYPLEAHVVHATPSGDLGVLATMFQYAGGVSGMSRPNALVKKVMDSICDYQKIMRIPFPSILGSDKGILAYNGSLTTPPCSEGVMFFMQEKIQIVTAPLVAKYTKTAGSPVDTNNRPVQPLNGRSITRFM